ncbi:MAG: zinc-ribbon domain-containing protein [Alphaproteobacteria bacterium]|nr:zinc-ribbon domain-containing protein [Alphaproteobacteria bacterium]USO07494.1 MAG: zinc-ribbon domain-containing protein [Rhodospirillales bacterium]
MKLNCPECSSHFDIPAALIGPGGRRMRCPKCGHVWHQMPEQESALFDIAAPIDPIPDSVRPAHGDLPDDEIRPGVLSGLPMASLGRVLGGFVLGWALVVALVYALAAGDMLPRALSPLMPGGQGAAPAAGLEFRDLEASAHGDGVVLTGRIFNAADAPATVPAVEITAESTHGKTVPARTVRPEADTLPAQESVPFSVQLPDVPAGAHLRLRLVADNS